MFSLPRPVGWIFIIVHCKPILRSNLFPWRKDFQLARLLPWPTGGKLIRLWHVLRKLVGTFQRGDNRSKPCNRHRNSLDPLDARHASMASSWGTAVEWEPFKLSYQPKSLMRGWTWLQWIHNRLNCLKCPPWVQVSTMIRNLHFGFGRIFKRHALETSPPCWLKIGLEESPWLGMLEGQTSQDLVLECRSTRPAGKSLDLKG